MTARLDIGWIAGATEQEAAASTLVRSITQPKPHLRCPKCNSILYTRRHKLCGVCGEELPESLLFSVVEVHLVEQILTAERQKHRIWMNRRVSGFGD